MKGRNGARKEPLLSSAASFGVCSPQVKAGTGTKPAWDEKDEGKRAEVEASPFPLAEDASEAVGN